jgi:spore maturation protein CgeB
MPHRLRIAYLAHTIRSDWNNGNAHFLRGLLRSLGELGHEVTAFEPEDEWSISNLLQDSAGSHSLAEFTRTYSDLHIEAYSAGSVSDPSEWQARLRGMDAVILHEWNPPQLAHLLLDLRSRLGYKLLFHDTHHRASSSPEQIALFRIDEFDGVLAFGEALRTIYRERFGITRSWTLHEAADVSIFTPRPGTPKTLDCVWIGNWGDNERSEEIRRFLLKPAAHLRDKRSRIYGVRYPQEGLEALREAGVEYGGYLPNLDAPQLYAQATMTVHVPRQQYTRAMAGIPTIRVFEALACGIPLISAPWQDTEHLFREGDFTWAHTCSEMLSAMERILADPAAASAQAARGLETVLSRHTCRHRAEQLTSILEELVR